MRTKSAVATAVLGNPSHSARAIVTVYSSAGVAKVLDESGLLGVVEPTLQVEVEHSIDGPRTARVTLRRQQGLYSLAPLVTSGNPLYGSEPIIAIGRRILIECELLPPDISPAPSGVRETIFDGYIDEVTWPEDEMELVCTDKSAKLRDTWIEVEKVYAFGDDANATAGAYLWSEDYSPTVGDLVLPSQNQSGHYYQVTAKVSAGGTTEPTWPTGSAATVVSGGVTYTEAGVTDFAVGQDVEIIIQQLIDDNGLSALVILQTPASPGWKVKAWKQNRQSLLEALQTIVDQLGWWLRFEWNAGLAKYELTLGDPGRSSSTVHKVLTEDDEVECTDVGVDVWSIRNAVRVIYSDGSMLDSGGNPKRRIIEVTDSSSITKYGRRFMEVAESSTSNIDTSAEATTMANAILADLKEPTVGVSVSFSIDPYLELGDRITLPSDGLRWTTGPTLAVESLKHSFDGSSARTSVTLRGSPASARNGWLDKDGRVNPADLHQLALDLRSDGGLTAADVVGGQIFSIDGDARKNAPEGGVELHISPLANFTPDTTTLASSSKSSRLEVGDLVPGKTYYAKTVPWARNASRIVRGAPSAELAFVAGRAKAGHYDSACTQSHLPLNGNFEHATDDLTSAPPDHWRVVTRPSESTETWGSSGSVYYGSDSSKGRYIELRAHASKRGNLVSSAFEVRRGCRSLNIYLSIMRTGSSASSGKDLIVDVSLYADSALSTLVRSDSIFLSGDSSGPYPSLSTWYDTVIDYGGGYGALPTNANFMVIALRRGTTGDTSFAWRIGDVYAQEADFYRASFDQAQEAWTNPTPNTGWSTGGSVYSGAFHPIGYMKNSLGFVELRGLAQRSAASAATVLFTLPSGYRPQKELILPAYMNGTYGGASPAPVLRVYSNGEVTLVNGPGAGATFDVGLDGVHFDTR